MSQRRDKIQRFTDLEVWRKSHELFLHLIVDLEHLPHTRIGAALTDQVIRSTGSIGANIAEGFNRSKAKYLNCLDIALGEANETENGCTNFAIPSCSCVNERTRTLLKQSKSKKCSPPFTGLSPAAPPDTRHLTPVT